MSISSILTMCPRSSDPFYIVTYYIKLVTTSWTDSTKGLVDPKFAHHSGKIKTKWFSVYSSCDTSP